eukprot:scaffold1046_cov162-Ochromonas_danica.AAC.20
MTTSCLNSQIRLMMSAAFMSTLGVLPEHFIQTALSLPYYFHLPLAPAEGLLLSSSGFARNVNGQDMALSSHTASSPYEQLLMEDQDYAASEKFLQEKIYQRIEEDWVRLSQPADNNGEETPTTVLQTYRNFMKRFEVPDDVSAQWKTMLESSRAKEAAEEEIRVAKEIERMGRRVKEFADLLAERPEVSEYDTNWEPRFLKMANKRLLKDVYQHRVFLPNGLATTLAATFQTLPGLLLTQTLRSLAAQVALGKLPASLSVEDLLQVIRDHSIKSGQSEKKVFDEDDLRRYVQDHPPLRIIV